MNFIYSYIEIVAGSQPTQLAMPMRMLEIYTNPSLYDRPTGDPLIAMGVIQEILDYLIHNGPY